MTCDRIQASEVRGLRLRGYDYPELYLKTRFVPRSKHTPFRLQKKKVNVRENNRRQFRNMYKK